MSMRLRLKHHRTEDFKACTISHLATLVLVGKASSSLKCLSKAKLLSIRNPWRIRVNQTRPRSNTAHRPFLLQLPSFLTLNQWWRLRIWSYRNFTIKKIPLKQIRIIMKGQHSTNPTWSPNPRFSCHLGFMVSNSISSSCLQSQRPKRHKIKWSTWSICRLQVLKSRGIN